MSIDTFNAGLVWGTPVRPDLLGVHLGAYKKALPTLNALRLCHRFGVGPKAHITKLPIEVEQAIEDIVFDRQIVTVNSRSEWVNSFMHFEGRCEPIDHALEGYCDIFDEVECEFLDELCDKCKEQGHCSKDCENDCRALIDGKINEGLYERDESQFETCMAEHDTWEKLIDQKPDGNFAKYDKVRPCEPFRLCDNDQFLQVLRKNFGLEAYFGTTRVTEHNLEAWPSDPNHKWHTDKALETTICFLTLPKQMTGETYYPLSEMEGEGGFLDIRGSQSYFVEPPTVHDRDKIVKQFQRALRVLKLKPYVHLSQLKAKVSATVLPEDASQNGSEGDGAEEESQKVKGELSLPYYPPLID